MKRLNIKSVFTHHSQNQQPQQQLEPDQDQQQHVKSEESASSEDGKCEESGDAVAGDKSNSSSSNVAFPGMVHTPPSSAETNDDTAGEKIGKVEKDNYEDEEEIDDDEEHSLKIDE